MLLTQPSPAQPEESSKGDDADGEKKVAHFCLQGPPGGFRFSVLHGLKSGRYRFGLCLACRRSDLAGMRNPVRSCHHLQL